MYKEGRGVEKNIVKAIELFTKTCNDEADFGCAALDDIYDNLSENKNEARHYYSKACDSITEKTYACAQYRRLIKEQCLEIFKYFVIGAGIIAMFAAVYLFRRKSLEQPR
jgi:TPR repeat protein